MRQWTPQDFIGNVENPSIHEDIREYWDLVSRLTQLSGNAKLISGSSMESRVRYLRTVVWCTTLSAARPYLALEAFLSSSLTEYILLTITLEGLRHLLGSSHTRLVDGPAWPSGEYRTPLFDHLLDVDPCLTSLSVDPIAYCKRRIAGVDSTPFAGLTDPRV